MPGQMDDVTLQEVARVISDMRQEFRTQLSGLVRVDVYRAEQSALTDRVKRLEQDQERHDTDRSSDRRMVMSSFLVAGGTFIGSLIMFVIAVATHH